MQSSNNNNNETTMWPNLYIALTSVQPGLKGGIEALRLWLFKYIVMDVFPNTYYEIHLSKSMH